MRPHEQLDEMIDRVAHAMTQVVADEAFSRRLATRLDAPSRLPWWLAVPAAAVIIVAAIIGGASRSRGPAVMPAAFESGDRAFRGAASASVMADNPTAVRDGSSRSVAVTRMARRSRRAELAPFESTVTALPQPAMLEVDNLTFDSLAIAPVAVAPIGPANLEVRSIDGTEPKE